MICFLGEAEEELHCCLEQHRVSESVQNLVDVLHGGARLSQLDVVQQRVLEEFEQELVEVEDSDVFKELRGLDRVNTFIEKLKVLNEQHVVVA